MLVWPWRCKGSELYIAGVYVQGDDGKFIVDTSWSKETTTSGRATTTGKNESLRPILLRPLLYEERVLSASIASTVVRCLHLLLDRRADDERVVSVPYRQQTPRSILTINFFFGWGYGCETQDVDYE